MSTLVCCEPVVSSAAVGRRDNLKLALNRSLSEPGPATMSGYLPNSPTTLLGPNGLSISEEQQQQQRATSSGGSIFPVVTPKRCKLEAVSLPASPCSESNTIQRQLVLQRTRTISADELAQKLSKDVPAAPAVLIDCRPFIVYNVNHVRGAFNVNCSDRFNRRRLQLGKASLADLATAREGKETLRRKHYREVIVYDDCTADLEHLPQQHPLFLVLAALVDDNREPSLLIGECFDVLEDFLLYTYKVFLRCKSLAYCYLFTFATLSASHAAAVFSEVI